MAAVQPLLAQASDYPKLSWQEFLNVFVWEQGEHMTLIGPTGYGKSTLAFYLMPHWRRHIAVLSVKPHDELFDRAVRVGYRRIKQWTARVGNYVIVDARSDDPGSPQQVKVVQSMLKSIYNDRGWTLYIDELTFVSEFLGLRRLMDALYQHMRSSGVTVVGGAQRPAWVPRYAYSSATHLFLWSTNDEEDLRSISGLGGMDPRPIREAVRNLEDHEFLYVNTRKHYALQSCVDT